MDRSLKINCCVFGPIPNLEPVEQGSGIKHGFIPCSGRGGDLIIYKCLIHLAVTFLDLASIDLKMSDDDELYY